MGIRKKTIFNKTSLVLFLGLALIMFFSGCMESKVSAAEEINTSLSLINNAESRFEEVASDLDSGTYTNAKTELKASRVDFEEALKILNNTSSDYDEENQEIERQIIFAEAGLDRVNSSENMIIALEHLEKSVAHMKSNDLNLSKEELDKTNNALNNSTICLSSAKKIIFSADLDSVPVGQKSYVTALKSNLETSERMSLEFRDMINGMYPYIDGYEHLLNSLEYMKTNEWGKAADEYANSSVKFSESKAILEKLEDSEYSEISVTAIEICGILNKIEKDLPHFETGCRYMDQGRYSQAESEFNKISYYSLV